MMYFVTQYQIRIELLGILICTATLGISIYMIIYGNRIFYGNPTCLPIDIAPNATLCYYQTYKTNNFVCFYKNETLISLPYQCPLSSIYCDIYCVPNTQIYRASLDQQSESMGKSLFTGGVFLCIWSAISLGFILLFGNFANFCKL